MPLALEDAGLTVFSPLRATFEVSTIHRLRVRCFGAHCSGGWGIVRKRALKRDRLFASVFVFWAVCFKILVEVASDNVVPFNFDILLSIFKLICLCHVVLQQGKLEC
jgi:hypothetical protein